MKTSKIYQFSEGRMIFLKGGPSEEYVPVPDVGSEEFEQEVANLTAEVMSEDLDTLKSLQEALSVVDDSVEDRLTSQLTARYGISTAIDTLSSISEHSPEQVDVQFMETLADARLYLTFARLYQKNPDVLRYVEEGGLMSAVLSGEITDSEFVDFYPKFVLENLRGDGWYQMLDADMSEIIEFVGKDPYELLVKMAGEKPEIVAEHYDKLVDNFELSREQQLTVIDLAMAEYYQYIADAKRENPGKDMTDPFNGFNVVENSQSHIARLQSIQDGI